MLTYWLNNNIKSKFKIVKLYCLDLGKKLLFAWVGAWSLSNKLFSSVTAYLVYWVIVTNTVVVFHNQAETGPGLGMIIVVISVGRYCYF